MNVSRGWSRVLGAVLLGALVPVAILVAELPPGHEVDEKTACLGCHDLEDAFGAAVQHAPVAEGNCSACHNPHVSRFSALLRERPGLLCAECHSDLTKGLDKRLQHAPVAEGDCSSCHAPHGGAHKDLLVDTGSSLCGTCHAEVRSWIEKKVQHAPFAQGRCASCHDPHASQGAALTKAEGSRLCAACHQTDAGFRATHSNYPVEQAACHQCHDPHASARRGLFRESLHAPFEGGDCSTCHAAPGSSDPFAIIKPVTELCSECHEEQAEAGKNAVFPHVSAGGGACVSCHNPHTGDGAGLLHKETNLLCLSCHNPGGAKSGESGRYLTHAGEVECTTCHSPHGAERPLLFAEDSVELCGTCHDHEHGVRHPLGEETLDPRTGGPMTCQSCHGIHHAPFEFYLHASDERDLCLPCHRELGGGGS